MLITLDTQITRLRAPLVSAGYGNQSFDWSNAASTTFKVKWSFKTTSEVVGDEARTVTRGYVFGWPGLDLVATDRVIGPDGLTYEVDGSVMPSYKPSGELHHVRAFLRRITTTVS